VTRAWQRALDAIPPVEGRTILDLGCGLGEQAAALAARGAHVIGVDLYDQRLRDRQLPHTEFRYADLRRLNGVDVQADGIWSSYAAAYLTDLPSVLPVWQSRLKPGGWMALLEIDDLFGHEPLSAAARRELDEYAAEALAAKRYDFHMGHKLTRYVPNVVTHFTIEDEDLAFDGPAASHVLDSWRARFDRMPALAGVRDEFLACLSDPAHRSRATVHFCLAQ
jgi:trans-aconitate methyltransferase